MAFLRPAVPTAPCKAPSGARSRRLAAHGLVPRPWSPGAICQPAQRPSPAAASTTSPHAATCGCWCGSRVARHVQRGGVQRGGVQRGGISTAQAAKASLEHGWPTGCLHVYPPLWAEGLKACSRHLAKSLHSHAWQPASCTPWLSVLLWSGAPAQLHPAPRPRPHTRQKCGSRGAGHGRGNGLRTGAGQGGGRHGLGAGLGGGAGSGVAGGGCQGCAAQDDTAVAELGAAGGGVCHSNPAWKPAASPSLCDQALPSPCPHTHPAPAL